MLIGQLILFFKENVNIEFCKFNNSLTGEWIDRVMPVQSFMNESWKMKCYFEWLLSKWSPSAATDSNDLVIDVNFLHLFTFRDQSFIDNTWYENTVYKFLNIFNVIVRYSHWSPTGLLKFQRSRWTYLRTLHWHTLSFAV